MLSSYICSTVVMTLVRSARRAAGACLLPLLFSAPAAAQTVPADSLTLQAAMDRAMASNPTIAAARMRRAINVAGVAVAGERLNPEGTFEIEKETPKQSFAFAMPLELGGKRDKRIALSEATVRPATRSWRPSSRKRETTCGARTTTSSLQTRG